MVTPAVVTNPWLFISRGLSFHQNAHSGHARNSTKAVSTKDVAKQPLWFVCPALYVIVTFLLLHGDQWQSQRWEMVRSPGVYRS
jgi:hypothetical protein